MRERSWQPVSASCSNIRNLPINLAQPGIGQISVDVREAPATEKLSNGQRRGMCTRDHNVVRLCNQLLFLLGFTPPQYEDDTCLFRDNEFDDAISKSLPAVPLMRIGLVCPDRKNRVEHENTLSGPGFQITVIRDPTANIFMEFPIDVSQREGQRSNGGLHRETEAMGITGSWIGVLPNEQHANLGI
jgi:hypothetical protein